MKKLLSLTLMTLIMFCGYASARCIYDSTGRHMIYNDTLRARRAAQAQNAQTKQVVVVQQNTVQAAAAAKIDYDKLLQELEETPAEKKDRNNFAKSRIPRRELPESTLKSNYIQSR